MVTDKKKALMIYLANSLVHIMSFFIKQIEHFHSHLASFLALF